MNSLRSTSFRALRHVSKRAGSSAAPAGPFTVAENTIHITFVDREGNRARVPARVGRSLLQTAQMHKIDLEGSCHGGGAPAEIRRTDAWVETTFGEGPTCFHCHVQIPSKFNSILPEQQEDEKKGLMQIWGGEEVSTSSRLACMIELEKKHDGMTVYVPDAPPVDLI